MLLLQLTDCHLLEDPTARLLGVRTAETFLAVLDQALAEATPDLLLLTGDLAHDGKRATYEWLLEQVAERYTGKVLVLPGNHDHYQSLIEVFPAAQHPLGVGLHDFPDFKLVTVDSQGDDRPEAELDEAARQRLLELVAEATKPVLLVLHHPLLPVGAPWLDKDCVPAGEKRLTARAETGKLAAVVFGHVHQPVTAHFGTVPLLGSPSTCFQFAPRSERFSLTAEQPGYRWLRIGGDQELAVGVGVEGKESAAGQGATVAATLRRLTAPTIEVEARFLAPS